MADAPSLEIIQERWNCATRDVAQFRGEHWLSGVNSQRTERLMDTLRELAIYLIHEQSGGADDVDNPEMVVDELFQMIEARLVKWAFEVEKARAVRRAGQAA